MSVPSTAVSDEDRRCRVVVKEHDLLCQNRCGFYGTPQWNGLCSQCWRASQTVSKSEDTFTKNRSLLTKEERRLPSVDPKNLVRSVIKKSPSVLSSPLLNAVSDSSPVEFHFTRSSSPDSLDADSQLHKYISKNFSPGHAKELERFCDAVIEKLYKKKQSPMDDLSIIIQDFYTAISDRSIKLGPIGADFTSSEFLEHIENFVCVRAYGLLFQTRSDEEALDLSLQQHIRRLHWVVSHGFLETALDFESKKVDDLLNDSMAEISEMNSHKKIKEKFDCLLKCSEKLFEAIRESTNAPAGADEFLPALIYVILRSNPTLIQSNINFIQRFSLTSRTCRGETGYQFTNLCCAVRFIQDLNADSLRISKEEFEEYNLGKQPTFNRIRSHVSATKSLENSLRKMNALNEDTDQVQSRINELSEAAEKSLIDPNSTLDKLLEAPDLVLPPELELTKLIRLEKIDILDNNELSQSVESNESTSKEGEEKK